VFMSVSTFKALPWRKQNEAIKPYILATLQDISEPWSTKRVMLDVANRVGWLDTDLNYLPRADSTLATVLKRFAQFEPGWAVRGEEFEFAGKPARRWEWQPQPKPDQAELLADIFS
jgi:hypothetical protein